MDQKYQTGCLRVEGKVKGHDGGLFQGTGLGGVWRLLWGSKGCEVTV